MRRTEMRCGYVTLLLVLLEADDDDDDDCGSKEEEEKAGYQQATGMVVPPKSSPMEMDMGRYATTTDDDEIAGDDDVGRPDGDGDALFWVAKAVAGLTTAVITAALVMAMVWKNDWRVIVVGSLLLLLRENAAVAVVFCGILFL